jgi:hypothetical protein
VSEPTAYCAPGRKQAAAVALALRGENYGEIKEHPWLEGRDDILMVYPEALRLGLPEPWPWEPEVPGYHDPPWWERHHRLSLGRELREFVTVVGT